MFNVNRDSHCLAPHRGPNDQTKAGSRVGRVSLFGSVASAALLVLAPGTTLAADAETQSAQGTSTSQPRAEIASAADPAANEPEMGFRSRRLVQAILRVQGHYDGPLDGVIGRGTRQSIRRYQIANGFAPTGYLTSVEVLTMFAESKTEAEELIVELQEAKTAETQPVSVPTETAVANTSPADPEKTNDETDNVTAASATMTGAPDTTPRQASSAEPDTRAPSITASIPGTTIATARDLPEFVSADGQPIVKPASNLPSANDLAATSSETGQTVPQAPSQIESAAQVAVAPARTLPDARVLPPAELAPPEPKPEPEAANATLPLAQPSVTPQTALPLESAGAGLAGAGTPDQAGTAERPVSGAAPTARVGITARESRLAERPVTPRQAEATISTEDMVRTRTGISPVATEFSTGQIYSGQPTGPRDSVSRLVVPEPEAEVTTRERPMRPSDVGVAFDASALEQPDTAEQETVQADSTTSGPESDVASDAVNDPAAQALDTQAATDSESDARPSRVIVEQVREPDASQVDLVLESPGLPAGLGTARAQSVAVTDNAPGLDRLMDLESATVVAGADGQVPGAKPSDATVRAVPNDAGALTATGPSAQSTPELPTASELPLATGAQALPNAGTQVAALPDATQVPSVVAPADLQQAELAPGGDMFVEGRAENPEPLVNEQQLGVPSLQALSPDALAPDALAPSALAPDALAPDALAPGESVGSAPLRGIYSGQDSDMPSTLLGSSVVAPAVPALQVSRETSGDPAAVTSGDARGEALSDGWLRDLNGTYTGYMEDPDLAGEIRVKTRFRFVDGELVGQFSALVNGRARRGRLSDAKVVGARTIEMSWRHLWDSGPVRFHFSNDLSSFNGQWGHDRIENVAWVGARR